MNRVATLILAIISATAGTVHAQIAGAGAGAAEALRDIERERLGLPPASSKLFVFGGDKRDTFLGCLTCEQTDPDSVHNPVGTFGSSVSRLSIRNPVSEFGSVVSASSACNPIAPNPPIVADVSGKVLGELTSNTTRRSRITNRSIVRWLMVVCKGD